MKAMYMVGSAPLRRWVRAEAASLAGQKRPLRNFHMASSVTGSISTLYESGVSALDQHTVYPLSIASQRISSLGAARSFTSATRGRPLPPTDRPSLREEAQDFANLGISTELQKALTEMGIVVPTETQRCTLPQALKGTDLLMTAETGSGKTLAFLLPVIQRMKEEERSNALESLPRRPRVLIVSPSRELALQTYNVAKKMAHHAKFRTVALTGGASFSGQRKALSQPVDVVTATPGRVVSLGNEGALFYSNVRYLILDEVDTLFDKTCGFLESIEAILHPVRKGAERRKEKVQVLLAAATLPTGLAKKLQQAFPGVKMISTANSHVTPSQLEVDFIRVTSEPASKISALGSLLAESDRGQTIIFCNSSDSCYAVEHLLRERDFSSVHLSKKVPTPVRTANFQKFATGEAQFLVCTDLAARGLDIPAVEHVIMFDFARTAVDYLHRAGRTARAGRRGKLSCLVAKYDTELATRMKESSTKRVISRELQKSETPSATSGRRPAGPKRVAVPSLGRKGTKKVLERKVRPRPRQAARRNNR